MDSFFQVLEKRFGGAYLMLITVLISFFLSWETSMQFESRFTTVDYYHRLFEVVRYLFVSTAIVHIKSVQLFSDASSTETIIFISAIIGEMFIDRHS